MKRTLGVCYYPEHWPKSFWKEDAKRMAEAGLSWVQIGEFAWSKIEPSPGCLLYTSPSPRDLSTSRMPSSA